MENKSFTLIELLVVIAIIGLISSIVLVNLKGVREKARIAKGLEFSQSLYHTLGAYSVGIWRFDEGSGTTAYDSSGEGNQGTINGASYTQGILGNALQFNGAGDYVNCGNAASFNILSAVTIEAWIKADSFPAGTTYLVAKRTRYELQLWSGGRFAGGVATVNSPWQSGVPVASLPQTIFLGKWHHVVMTYTSGSFILYVDAQVIGSTADITGNLLTNNDPLVIGWGQRGEYFDGTIDEVRIYNQALTSAEIQKHYAEGLEKHQNLAMK